MSKIIITGAASGLGRAIGTALAAAGHQVWNFDIVNGPGYDVAKPDTNMIDRVIADDMHGLDVLINCAGVNVINWLEQFTEEDWDKVMNVNAKGIFAMSKACLPHLIASKGTIVNIVSNAAHNPMTCSLAYNASKGAAHIMTLQLARELTKRHGITVFGIAPNKLAGTGMSDSIDEQVVATRGWTKEYAQQYQLNGLLAGQETPPLAIAGFLEYLLKEKDNHRFLTGTVLPYGA